MRRSIQALGLFVLLCSGLIANADQQYRRLRIAFVGDVMGHNVNYHGGDFREISEIFSVTASNASWLMPDEMDAKADASVPP